MNITTKRMYKIQTLLLCLDKEPEIKAEKLINNAPEDIGELSFEKFISISKYANVAYNYIMACAIYTDRPLEKLYTEKAKKVLKTGKYYFDQVDKFLEAWKNISESFEVPSKYSMELQNNYGWFGLLNMLAKDDLSKHENIKKMPLYDVMAAVKLEMDKNYTQYLKLKQS